LERKFGPSGALGAAVLKHSIVQSAGVQHEISRELKMSSSRFARTKDHGVPFFYFLEEIFLAEIMNVE
jgi:hypothetical protein